MSGATMLYEQSAFPIFQNRMYDSAQEARACPRGDIRLVQDGVSGLVYNAAFRPELMNYDAAYQNEQAHSPSFKSHLEQVATIVERNLGTDGLVEVGCGKAYFLELLQSRGCSITGFDPTYEGQNPAVQLRYFGDGVTVSASGLVLRHVLEHVQDPVGFLDGLREANGGGLIYIEVPCFDWILRASTPGSTSSTSTSTTSGLEISRAHVRPGGEGGHLFGGQYLYVVADLATLATAVSSPADRVGLSGTIFWRRAKPSRASDRVGGASAVWGAASKGVIFALLRQRCGNPVDVRYRHQPGQERQVCRRPPVCA